MKKTFLLGFICLAAIACDKTQDATPAVKLETTIISSAKISAGEDLKTQLLEVNDSRCPINADCITAGAADLKINISDAANQVDVAVLFSSANKNSGSQEFKLSGQNYILTVSEVLPYPEIDKPTKLEDFKVNVTISKK